MWFLLKKIQEEGTVLERNRNEVKKWYGLQILTNNYCLTLKFNEHGFRMLQTLTDPAE